jgi:hypothetical protein
LIVLARMTVGEPACSVAALVGGVDLLGIVPAAPEASISSSEVSRPDAARPLGSVPKKCSRM